MPKLTVNGQTQEWESSKRLVKAIEEMGIHIGHRCGGHARCTTCRVRVISGEPEQMTAAEHAKLHDRGIYGEFRLACQLCVSEDMEVEPMMTLENQEGWTDTGPVPADTVEPEATWQPKSAYSS